MSSNPGRSHERLVTLITDIYDAALDASRWRALLPELVQFVGATRCGFGIAAPDDTTTDLTLTHELDPELLERWQRDFAGFDPVYERVGALPEGMIFRAWDAISAQELRRLEMYADCISPLGIDDQLVTILTSSGDRRAFFSAYRSQSEGPFSAEDVRAYHAIGSHLVRAARIQEKLHSLSFAEVFRDVAFEVLPFGVLILDPAGAVVSVNREAERILAVGDALRICARRLTLYSPEAEAKLHRAIGRARAPVAPPGLSQASVLAAPRRNAKKPYQLLVAPIPPHAAEAVFSFESRSPAALVVVSDPEASVAPAAETLRRLFSLTPALSRLAAALASGKTLREYAGESGVTEGTARQQLKELFMRTGTSRQADLMRVLLSGVGQLRI